MLKKRTRNLLALILLTALVLTQLTACFGSAQKQNGDIIVLFTNDVHCGVDDYIGYAGLAAYHAYCQTLTPYTTLVDCGDAIQGGLIGSVSDGEYIIDIMNFLDYDFAVLGNHEFDFGMERLTYLMNKAEATYLGCNITYSGSKTNAVEALVPYEIVEYGDTEVAYIGVTTPNTLTSATPTYFMENGEFVYRFHMGGTQQFYDCVQGYIDECKEKGADYVILLTHLGDTDADKPYSSIDLIENTVGADAVLDGHAHSEIASRPVKDKEGDTVLLSSTGTKLEHIGQLTISENGTLTTTLVSPLDWCDAEADAYIKEVQSRYEAEMNRVIATAGITLSGYTADGVRLVRTRETTVGNLCADAYRAITGADIAVVNGGGVRADIKQGDVTYADLIAVHPFGNKLCMIEITGQELLDALEVSYVAVEAAFESNGQPVGENGEFMQISGMKLTIDTSIPSSVVFDGDGMLESIGETRRLKNVMILNQNGEYEPIELQKTYTLASHNYYLKNNGGNHRLFDDNKLLLDESLSDYEVLAAYITNTLGGVIDQTYAQTEGRITVE